MSFPFTKIIAVLQVTPEHPTAEHIEMFGGPDCDFYFVTHDAAHPDAVKFCPNTSWAETRNVLVELVPREYEYYAFVDYDYEIESLTQLSVLEQMISDLDLFKPAVLVPYPGDGLLGPLAGDLKYRQSRAHSVRLFAHAGLVVVHHTLLDWFFPLVTQFDGGFSAAHLFNILQIPFMKNIIMSHKFMYHNRVLGPSESNAPHNKSVKKSHQNMDKMWHWIRPAFEIHDFSKFNKALDIKKYFTTICDTRQLVPEVNNSDDLNYYDPRLLRLFFDPRHEYFKDKGF
ncbi:MAG: hypothetical protein FVQ79_01845 [Planctomycetes bacterium]|nr:hypothetical protein [Planctomycetota bacterium]